MSKRAFVLLLLAACGGREERAPVSRPSPAAAVVAVVAPPIGDAGRDVRAAEPPTPSSPPASFSLRDSEVRVTGGFGYSSDAYVHPTDPKPGERVELVRVLCTAYGAPDATKQFACSGAAAVSSDEARAIERRAAQCFTMKTRAATPAEALKVAAQRNGAGDFDVAPSRIFLVEERIAWKVPELRTQHCTPSPHQPCDPRSAPTGRMLPTSETHASAFGPGRTDATAIYWTWPLHVIDIAPPPAGSLEAQPPSLRAAMLYDRAVDAVRGKDSAAIAAAVQAFDAEASALSSLGPISVILSRDIDTLHALVAGRATIGDACIR